MGERVKECLKITHEQWVAMLCDPVMAVWVIFRFKLDVFQACRLRYYWWTQNVMDSSGVGSGKTIVVWFFFQLRAILLPQQDWAIYYPFFDTGKNSFWEYFADFTRPGRAPIFLAQLGDPVKTDPGEEIAGDGTLHGPGCYKAFYRNGNKGYMPAPGMARNMLSSASLTISTLGIEEWTHMDAMSDGINAQLIDRVRGHTWNQFHPIWGRHILFSAHAQRKFHPSAARFNAHQRKIFGDNRGYGGGDPTFANLHYSYKDYSNRLMTSGKTFKEDRRPESTIATKRADSSSAEWLCQYLGIWAADGEGWFTEQAMANCIEAGRRRGVTPVLSRSQYEEILLERLNPPSLTAMEDRG